MAAHAPCQQSGSQLFSVSDPASIQKPGNGLQTLTTIITNDGNILRLPNSIRGVPCNQSQGYGNVIYPYSSISQPELPCTIPDSQARSQDTRSIANHLNSHFQANEREKKMSQRSVATNDTEPVSQSVFNEMIARSNQGKAGLQLGRKLAQDAEQTQVSDVYEQEGHVDIVSSFHVETAPEMVENLENDVPYSSPQQTQIELARFPESQRFERSSTRGKKRDSQGAEVRSPQLPRNPLADQYSDILSSKGLGLTQVFQATQAQTSPFVNGMTSEPRSDRPSPHVNIQARPASSESASSPLLYRKQLRRNITEPYTSYTTLEESQVNKNKTTKKGVEEEDFSEDDFDQPSSWAKQQKFERKRREKRKQLFKTSPLPPQDPKGSTVPSSPSRNQLTSSPPSVTRRGRDTSREDIAEIVSDDGNELEDQASWSSGNRSEVETDRESGPREISKRSAPRRLQVDEEDKENIDFDAIRVPDTTRRLHERISDVRPDLSPFLQKATFSQTQRIFTSPLQNGISTVESSQHIAVENSQPPPSVQKIPPSDDNPIKTTATGNGVAVPQSQLPPNGTHVSASPTRSQSPTHATNSGVLITGTALKNRETNGEAQKSSSPKGKESAISHCETIAEARKLSTYHPGQIAVQSTGDPLQDYDVDDGLNNNIHSCQTTLPQIGQEQLDLVPQTSFAKALQSNGDVTAEAKTSSSSVGKVPGSSSNNDNISRPREASTYETANTHLQQTMTTSNPAPNPSRTSSMHESPSGSKRKRMSAITGSASPQKSAEEADFTLQDILPEDGEFQKVLEGSSPITSGRNRRRRLNEDGTALPDDDMRKSTQINNTTKTPLAQYMSQGGRNTISDKIFDFDPQSLPSPPARQSVMASSQKPKSAARGLSRPKKRLVEQMTTSKSRKASNATRPRTSSNEARPIIEIVNQKRSTSLAGADYVESKSTTREVVAPNQVFARYDANTRGYYPAKCLGVVSGEHPRCTIQWEGYDPDEVDTNGVRRLELQIGDQVKIDMQGFPKVSHIVRGFKDTSDKDHCLTNDQVTDIFGNRTLIVAPKQRKSLPVDLAAEQCREIAVSNIYLDSNMWNQMKGRAFEFTQRISPQQGFATPPERPSTPSTPGSRSRRISLPLDMSFPKRNGLFADMVFAISYNDEIRKRSIANFIIQSGGQVLENGFQDLFDIQTVTLTSGSEQNLRKPSDGLELALRPRATNLKFAALIADRHSRKPKYMQALALNLPCLNGRWIEACVTKDLVLDWQPYLLPSGDSIALDGATKSRILAPYDPLKSSLSATFSNRPKLFSGQSVTFVNSKGKKDGKKAERRDDFVFLAQAMGASTISVAPDLAGAKSLATEHNESNEFCWIVADENDKRIFGKIGERVEVSVTSKDVRSKLVSFDYIIQSIILGNLLAG